MNSLKTYQRLAAALIVLLSLAFLFAAYRAINNIVAEQSRIQQQALSPVYKLVRDELLRPLYIAETFASSINFTSMMDSTDIDEEAVQARLAQMQQDLDLLFFVAIDKTRRQLISNGSSLDLKEGEVWWYFEAIEQDKDFMADLGQVGDVHLFYDVKMYSDTQEFLGYVGVGKRIQRFLDTFDQYKAQYGYDFLFLNDQNDIILSSLPDLVVTDAYIPTLESLAWFDEERLGARSLDSELLQLDGGDYLVSEFGIEELGWRLLLLVPLEARQTQITRSFFTNTLAATIIVLMLIGAALYLMLLYKRGIEKDTEIDPLSGLPNRKQIQRRFEQMKRSNTQLCVILVDLDNFKAINDTYGHHAGDQMIKAAADTLKLDLRALDLVGRWGGEEFLMLVPATSIEMGNVVAERARENLEAIRVDARDATLRITGSFGVAFGSSSLEALTDILARADAALYEAKTRGRNQVRLQSSAVP